MTDKPFCEQLVEARQAAGLKQIQAARLYGIPWRTWQDWELNQRTPPLYVQKSILDALKEKRKL